MTNPQPTNADEELDRLLLEARTDEYGDSGNYNAEKLKRLILADRKKHELAARLDEYKNHMPCTKYPNHYQVDKHHLDELIAELKAELEKL